MSGAPVPRDSRRDMPAALRARLAQALSASAGGASAPAPTAAACLEAGEALLAQVLGGDPRSRATALDLLAADALVTWAFELAAARAEDFEAVAGAAMRRIAAHAPEECG